MYWNRFAPLLLFCLALCGAVEKGFGGQISFLERAHCERCGEGGSCGCWGPGLYWVGLYDCPVRTVWPRCQKSYAGYPSQVYFDAEYLVLFRDTLNPEPSVTPGPSFDGNFASGVLLTAGMELAPRYRLESSYFGSHTWSDATFLSNGDPVSFNSELNNVEFVLRHHVATERNDFEASYSIGGRFMDIEDQIVLNLQETAVRNELLGLQGGLLSQFLVDERTWIDWEIKGVIANNEVAVSTVGQNNVTSFIGETSVVVNYHFLPAMTFRIGYRGIWVTGLGLAVENLNVPAEINDSGEMAYHGLNVGLVWSR